jgi:hypothetical protein
MKVLSAWVENSEITQLPVIVTKNCRTLKCFMNKLCRGSQASEQSFVSVYRVYCARTIFWYEYMKCLLQGLPPYSREEVCALQWYGELCWRERKLMVGPPMPDRSKVKVQTKCSTWSSRLWVWRGANDPIPEKFTVSESREPTKEVKAHTGLQHQ